MDEEEQQQSDSKISVSSFFERVDSVDKVANSALSKSNANFNIINNQKTLINSINVSIEALETKVRDIANYIIIEKKLEKDAEEDRLFEKQDEEQKGSMLERLAGLKPNNESEQTQTAPGEEPKKGGGGILGTLLSLGIGAFALKFLWPALLPLLKTTLAGAFKGVFSWAALKLGALLGGIIGAIPLIGKYGPKISKGVTEWGQGVGKWIESGIKNIKENGIFPSTGSAGGGIGGGGAAGGEKKVEDGKEEKSKYDELVEAGFEFDDKGMVGGQRVIDYKGPDDGKETFFSKGLGGILGIGEGSKLTGRYKRVQSEGGTKTLLGKGSDASLEDIINKDESIQLPKGRGIGSRLLGGLDALTGNITDFDQEGGKTSGGGRILGGLIDAATGNFTDIDKEGGETVGTGRIFGGILDAVTGDKYNFDKKEKKKKEIDSEVSNKNLDLSLSEILKAEIQPLNDRLDTLSEDFTGSINAESGQMFSRPANSPTTTVTVFKQTSSNSPFTSLMANKYLSLNSVLPPEVYRSIK